MSARYGDRTRSGEPVGNAGQRQTGAVVKEAYEEVFLAPGTWTWPGKVSSVEVLVVGGGGGTATFVGPAPSTLPQRAGGGGVGVFSVPVSGPVPVTVGAGGTAGAASPTPLPLSYGGNGGTSAFGPLSPPIPPTTAQVGGGDGAYPGSSTIPTPLRGGGMSEKDGGAYGFPGGVGTTAHPNVYLGVGGGGAGSQGTTSTGGASKFGFGAGTPSGSYHGTYGSSRHSWAGTLPANVVATAGRANSGHAGGLSAAISNPAPPSLSTPAPILPTTYNGAAGGSGIVIVRWFE